MNRTILLLCPLLLAVCLAGCSDSDSKPDSKGSEGDSKDGDSAAPFLTEKDDKHSEGDGHGHDHDTTTGSEGERSSVPAIPQPSMPMRDTVAGRWILWNGRYSQMADEQGQNLFGEQSTVLLEVTTPEGDQPGTIDVITAREAGFLTSKIEIVELTDTSLRFKGTYGTGILAFEFSGKLHQGVILGMIEFGDGRQGSARMMPSDERTFARVEVLRPFPEFEEFVKTMQSPVPIADAKDFAAKYPTSPLPRLVYAEMIRQGMLTERPTADIDDLINDMIESQRHWGRLLMRVYFEITQLMMQTGYDIEFCSEKMDEFEVALNQLKEGANESDTKAIDAAIKLSRELLEYRQAMDYSQSSDPEKHEKGLELARKRREMIPFDAYITHILANDARENGRPDEAMRLFAELAVLPLQEKALVRFLQQKSAARVILPSERLAKLWQETSQEGSIDDYSAKVYEDQLLYFAKDPVATRPEGDSQRIVLCEVFGSTEMHTGVAADVAVSGLQKTLPHSVMVVLRYHQHDTVQQVSSLNPLANGDSEARAYNYYGLPTTPAVILDGMAVSRVEGVLMVAPDYYKNWREAVLTSAQEKEGASVNLQATRDGDVVQIEASVEGENLQLDDLRLRLALTESGIKYTGFNGIRQHDMVVRAMPGGDRGIKAAEDGLKYSGSVDIARLRTRLKNYLDRFEKSQGEAFAEKPVELKNLHIVAFVQSESTHRVLQTAIVPVSE